MRFLLFLIRIFLYYVEELFGEADGVFKKFEIKVFVGIVEEFTVVAA